MIEMTNVLPVRGSEILLAIKKRGHGVGRWNGMGGKIEPGETIKQAAIRETREEVGIKITDFEKRAELIFNELHKGEREQIIVHVFVASSWQGEPQETEEMAPRWFKLSAIPYAEMWSDDEYWLPPLQVLEGKLVRGRFALDENDTLISHDVKEVAAFD